MGEGRSKFWFPPTEGGIWKIKKRAWKYGAGAGLYKGGRSTVQGQVFIKGGGGADTFPISLFQGLSFLHLESTLPFAKPCYAFEKKNFFSVTIILWIKAILSCLKMNLKTSHKLR